MTRARAVALPLVLWLVATAVAATFVARGQAAERDALVDRFQNRSDTGSDFVASYVEEVFETEERLAEQVADADWRTYDFAASSRFLGFSTALVLDDAGRAVALAPDRPELEGVDFAQQHAHLRAALAGTPTVSDVVSSEVTGEPVVSFAIPVSSPRIAVLSAGFTPATSRLAAFLERQPIPGTRGTLLDSRGDVITSAGGSSELATTLMRRLRSSPQEAILTDGRVVVGAPVPGTTWTYVLDAPRDVLLAPATQNNASGWVVLGLASLLTLGAILATHLARSAREHDRREKERLAQRLRLTMEHAPVGMALVTLDHRFVEPNRRLCDMLGYSAEELTRLTFEDVTHPDDVPLGLDRIELLIAGEIDSHELEKRYVRSDGSILWGRLSVSLVRDEAGAPAYFVKQVEDVTELRKARAELRQRALYDNLTGLANRSLLMDRLALSLASDRHQAHVGLAFCDVDHFKQINDTHGHQVGDEVLKVVARRLQQTVRAEDTVARLGGDEFVVLLHDVDSATEAAAVLDRANRSVKEPIVVDGITIHASLSGGLAFASPGDDPDVLLRDADAALYIAKNRGRGRIEVQHRPLRPVDGQPVDA